MKTTDNNVLVLQSGGCTPVMNRSLVGIVHAAFQHTDFGEVYGAVHGLRGLLANALIDLRKQPGKNFWSRIAYTPGAALGSGRLRLNPGEEKQALETLRAHRVGFLFTIGGNDSAETAHRIAQLATATGERIVVIHVPKTIDNDLPVTDHTPGYGSAARFVALATMGSGRDAEAMGEDAPITIIEVMGRDTGWLAASAVLGKRAEMDAPHYICMPEVPFDEDRFLERIEDARSRWGFAVAVTAENVRGPSGPLGHQAEPLFVDAFGHSYYDGAGKYMASLVGKALNVRVRYERPGTIQRSLTSCVSSTDAAEAYEVGRAAVVAAVEGHTDSMVTLERLPEGKYTCATGLAPLDLIAGQVRPMPSGYIGEQSGTVTQAFLEYARPLIGSRLPRFARTLAT